MLAGLPAVHRGFQADNSYLVQVLHCLIHALDRGMVFGRGRMAVPYFPVHPPVLAEVPHDAECPWK